MDYDVTAVTTHGKTTTDTRYNDDTATRTLRQALVHGFTLAADADAGRITLTGPERTLTLTPAEPLPKPTQTQRRNILALAASPGPIVWDYTRSGLVAMRDGDRVISHPTTLSLLGGRYLTALTGRGGPAGLTLLAYLVIGCGQRRTRNEAGARDARLAAALTRIYSAPAPR